MRGKANIGRSFLHVRGITPAYAGKRMETMTRRHAVGDHPRVCGEKISGTTLITTQQGSPPRMRGKAPSLRERLHWHRITPAYAGKSGISPGFLLSYRDHPRVCGEKESVNDGTAIRAGSPPRMRGKARSCQANTSVTRITPAYAGKSRRVREPDTQTAGSPPRMRGKVPTFHPPSGAVGITPAYAGKRRLCVVAAHLGRDHPRVCGEKST